MSGKGYIFLYPLTKEFVMTQGMVPDFLKGRYTGGFGSMMLVNYADSNVGPYSELLFIPGKFDYKGKKWQKYLFTISQRNNLHRHFDLALFQVI